MAIKQAENTSNCSAAQKFYVTRQCPVLEKTILIVIKRSKV